MSRDRERGASLVEFALVLPLIMMIVLGLVSAGVAYNLKITMTHAAREAARYAATLPLSNYASTSDWLQAVEDRLKSDAAGQLGVGQPAAVTCVAIITETTSGATTIAKLPAGVGPCFLDDRAGHAETRVQVLAGRDTDFNALFFSKTISLSSQAVAFYERED